MLSVIMPSVAHNYHYAECRYTECVGMSEIAIQEKINGTERDGMERD
jgi:hypothetical protein